MQCEEAKILFKMYITYCVELMKVDENTKTDFEVAI